MSNVAPYLNSNGTVSKQSTMHSPNRITSTLTTVWVATNDK